MRGVPCSPFGQQPPVSLAAAVAGHDRGQHSSPDAGISVSYAGCAENTVSVEANTMQAAGLIKYTGARSRSSTGRRSGHALANAIRGSERRRKRRWVQVNRRALSARLLLGSLLLKVGCHGPQAGCNPKVNGRARHQDEQLGLPPEIVGTYHRIQPYMPSNRHTGRPFPLSHN
jgi:hypothetical protein